MKRLVLFLIVSAALLAPSAALASGVVLKVQHATHLVAVTNGKTKVNLVHTAVKLRVGQRVTLSGRTLRNGTLAASSIKVVGRARTVHFRGLLLKKSGTRMVLSAGGAIISVKRGAVRSTSAANDTGPQPGATVDVTATVSSTDELDEDNTVTVSADAPGGSIEGKLTLGTGKITVVSEHMALVINVPSTFDLSKFKNGDEVLAKFTQGADGTLALTDLSGDDNAQEADDNDDGDNGDDDGDNGDDDGEHSGASAGAAAGAGVHI
jgi:Cu/Ag efflux protein CusF